MRVHRPEPHPTGPRCEEFVVDLLDLGSTDQSVTESDDEGRVLG
jgi:hypothetical protein